jgi:cytochrome c oxidase assembly protein subunit 11
MRETKSNRKVILIASTVAVIMFGFCFAIVPLYSLICQATGISTAVPDYKFNSLTEAKNKTKPVVDVSRDVTIQFVAVNHKGMPWDFYPRVKSVTVHPGENAKVAFYAKNATDKTMTVQAIPSMTPGESMSHFHKIECFCFKQQTLKGRESKNMPLIFYVDKDLPKNIRVITLAYTLFDITPTEPKKG